jgi:FMN phosphatase YigB (HAD superfamily)
MECRARHDRFADAPACLDELRNSYTLALITNGASCLQREKLATAGLPAVLARVDVDQRD